MHPYRKTEDVFRKRNNELAKYYIARAASKTKKDTKTTPIEKTVAHLDVPMMTFLTCTGVRNLEIAQGKPVEKMDFYDTEVFELPIFDGRYYTSLESLANQIRNFTINPSSRLDCPLRGREALVQFLAFIRGGKTRVEAAEKMKSMGLASEAGKNEDPPVSLI